jgi:hypothetical protein
VARHRSGAVARPREVAADASVLRGKQVVARPKVVAFPAGKEAEMSTLGYHGRFASSLWAAVPVWRDRLRRHPGDPASLIAVRGRRAYSEGVSRATSRLVWRMKRRHFAWRM